MWRIKPTGSAGNAGVVVLQAVLFLSWAPPPQQDGNYVAYYNLYRGQNAECADGAPPLTQLLIGGLDAVGRQRIGWWETTYQDATVPAVEGVVCYELAAVNMNGESAHSNRAQAVFDLAPPAQPGPVTIMRNP